MHSRYQINIYCHQRKDNAMPLKDCKLGHCGVSCQFRERQGEGLARRGPALEAHSVSRRELMGWVQRHGRQGAAIPPDMGPGEERGVTDGMGPDRAKTPFWRHGRSPA